MVRLTLVACLLVLTLFGNAANSRINLEREMIDVKACCDTQALVFGATELAAKTRAAADLEGGRFTPAKPNHNHPSCFAPPPPTSTTEANLF